MIAFNSEEIAVILWCVCSISAPCTRILPVPVPFPFQSCAFLSHSVPFCSILVPFLFYVCPMFCSILVPFLFHLCFFLSIYVSPVPFLFHSCSQGPGPRLWAAASPLPTLSPHPTPGAAQVLGPRPWEHNENANGTERNINGTERN
jgi:hypothetical protein